jgi:5-methylcytosine-specific restriction endonuclease McrA
MADRKPNTDQAGLPFSEETIKAVWKKALTMTNGLHCDICGTVISEGEYGNTGSLSGWEIDHEKPVAKGGTDAISNLQPLYWLTNRKKSDTYPWTCSMLEASPTEKKTS